MYVRGVGVGERWEISMGMGMSCQGGMRGGLSGDRF